MTRIHNILLHLTLAVFTITGAHSVTTEELSRYLGVSAWSTTVDLPASSFITEIWTIKDGTSGERLIEGMPAWNKNPKKGVTIMIGTENGKYKIVVAYGGGVTMTSSEKVPTFRSTMSGELPKTIKEGDFPLMGQPKMDGNRNPSEITAFTTGFVLRIKKQ